MSVTDVVTLTRAGVEVVLDLASGYPVILHWGAPLAGVAAAELRTLADGGIPHSDLDEPVDPGMLREAARGFVGRPAIRGHRGSTGFSPLFSVTGVDVRDDSCTVRLSDAALQLELELVLALTPEGVLLVDAALTNVADTQYTLDELALWLPVPDRATETLDFTGRWLRERQPQRLTLAPGLRLRESREGRSGHDYTIVQCALTSTTGTESGEVWGVGLLWSGGSRHLAERAVTGRAALGAGELIEPGEAELAPGQTYRTPTLAAFYASDGLDGMGARATPGCARGPRTRARTGP